MRYNEKNIVVQNVLSDYEIDQIYRNLEVSYRKYTMEKYGQQISDFWMPESALNKIISYCEDISGVSGLKLEAYQFSRYEKFTRDDGKESMPNLTPHFDTFAEPRFTFDYQIKSNTSWPIVVEENQFELSDNQAITFSGTHQIHWRPKKIFKEGEYIDMVFCHLSLPGLKENSSDHWSLMRQKEKEYTIKVGEIK